MTSSGWIRLLSWVFYSALVIFGVIYLQGLDWQGIGELELNWWPLLAATGLAITARLMFAELWLYFLMRLRGVDSKPFGARLRADLLLVYAKSWLGRYIPGAVTWLAGKVVFAARLGISKGSLAISSVLEIGLQILTVLSSGLVLVLLDDRANQLSGGLGWTLAVGAALGFLMLLPPIFTRVINLGLKLAKRGELSADLTPWPSTLAVGVLGFLGTALVSGLALFFVALSLDPTISTRDLLFILGASNLASALGMLAVFAPAGLGVRDGLQLAALLFVTEPATAVMITLLMRLASIVWDLLFLGLAFGWRAVAVRLGR